MKSLFGLIIIGAIALFFIPDSLAWNPVYVEVPGYAKRVMGSQDSFLDSSWYTQRPYYSFRSIHYATVPSKEQRFLPPVPNNYPYPDDEIYNAKEISLGCPQGDNLNEDCLILSIYTPYLPGNVSDPSSDPNTMFNNNLPVMFWIHGGSFSFGQNVIYEPQTFMEYDIVIVQVQYRLGALGYLSLDTDEVPGNAGMFDQIEGLRWVQKFIKYFGGDPNKVTIMGQSAGGASVGFLMVSPETRGLFHGVIGMGGSILAEWALDRNPRPTGLTIAEYAGCPLEPYSDLLDCLRNVSPRLLLDAQAKLSVEDMLNGGLGFGGASPVIQVAGARKALTREPREILNEGDYDTSLKIMFGANKHEGLEVVSTLYENYMIPNNLTEDEDFLKYDMVAMILKTLGVSDSTGVLADTLYDKYFSYAVDAGQEGNLTYLFPGMIDMCGVLFLKAGGYETVIIHSKHNPASYWYSFDYRGKFQLVNNDDIFPPGVGHADELMYLWNIPLGHKFNESETLMCHRMQRTWVNFIRFGNPSQNGDGEAPLDEVPIFPAYNSQDEEFMAINGVLNSTEGWEIRSDYTKYYTVSVDDLLQEKKKASTGTGNGQTFRNARQRNHPKELTEI